MSETNLIDVTVACAPLLCPKIVALFLLINPKNDPCASSDKEFVSIFKTLEDAEYLIPILFEESYGFLEKVSDGLFIEPRL